MKSVLDKLLEVLETMTDEEIVKATSTIGQFNSVGELGDLGCSDNITTVKHWGYKSLNYYDEQMYECKKCEFDEIQSNYKYCPECGRVIDWENSK